MKPLKTAEEELREILEVDGWNVVHKGWPDFACVRDGNMMFVEVKRYKGEMLKKEQHYILTNLARLGLNCYKWTPVDGFERIEPDRPYIAPNERKRKYHGRYTLQEKYDQLSPSRKEWVDKLTAEGIEVYL